MIPEHLSNEAKLEIKLGLALRTLALIRDHIETEGNNIDSRLILGFITCFNALVADPDSVAAIVTSDELLVTSD